MSCTEKGKIIAQAKISNPSYNTNEIRNPETRVTEQIGFSGQILVPSVYSPKKQFEACSKSRVPEKQCVLNVLSSLEISERVAMRQYDELLMFPELKEFVPDILGIRNDEQEHEEIIACIRHRIVAKQTVEEL
jgi:hypothetical protein